MIKDNDNEMNLGNLKTLTRCSVSALRQAAAAGKLPGARKISGAWIVPADAVLLPGFRIRKKNKKSYVWVSVREAALVLGLTPRRVQQLCKEKSLPAKRVGGVWLIPVSTKNGSVLWSLPR